ncbi:uncharacterized protein LOC131943420 [Physella acuta]|uniref:uncharacterized protein LOC131943420 n=1 Tax=Physella acuta TaxID=109671 RepID=UPI0027DBAD6E|nr:uncharacterized protein LOC131943420 [Physella acuta]
MLGGVATAKEPNVNRVMEGSYQQDENYERRLGSRYIRNLDEYSPIYIGCTGVEISVFNADITRREVDCIVSAANKHLRHGGGVARVISKAAGYRLQDECERYIEENKSVQVTGVFVSTGGDLPAKHVIHAVGPKWDDYVDKNKCTDDLRRTVLTCLLEATKREMSTIALPPISAAIFRVPQDLCAEAYMHAVKNYDALVQHTNLTALKEIHFVDISDAMIDSIKICFTKQWHTEKKCKFFEGDLNFAVAYMKKQSQASQVSRENLPKQDKRGKQNGAIFSSHTDKIGKAAHKAKEDKSVPSQKHPNSERVSSSPNSQPYMVHSKPHRFGSWYHWFGGARKSEAGSDVQLPITVTKDRSCSGQNESLDNLKYSLYTKQDKDELEYSFKIMNVNLGVSHKHAFDFKPDLIITLGDPHVIFSEHSDYHSANLFILDMGEKINNVQSLKLKRSSFVFQLVVDDVNQISLTEAFKNLTQAVNIIKEKVKSIVFTSNFHSKPTETHNKSELDPTVASLFAQHVCEFASDAAKETSPLRAIILTTNKLAIPYITKVFQATNFRVSSSLLKS